MFVLAGLLLTRSHDYVYDCSCLASQVCAYWAGCMLTAALNLALIVTIGSGISETRQHDYNSESAAASGKRFGTGNGANPAMDSARGGAGTTVV